MRTPRLPVVDLTDARRRFKWTRPFRRKTKSGFCAYAFRFQKQSTDNPPPCSVEVKERIELYVSSPYGPSWSVLGWALLLLICRLARFPDNPVTDKTAFTVLVSSTLYQPERVIVCCLFLKDLERSVRRIYVMLTKKWGPQWLSWLRHCATSLKVAGSIPDYVIGIFHWQSFRSHYGPGVDSAINRDEYQEYFLGVKAVGA